MLPDLRDYVSPPIADYLKNFILTQTSKTISYYPAFLLLSNIVYALRSSPYITRP